ncbi:MAG TPA: sigma-70 family RNA polymerase sigma factor [Myxococcota bacterium]|nr:sigma-70 family RNA polymerase sigma factor [Myxococcota bacterium]
MTDAAAAPDALAQVFADERRLLFGLCYRMTGSAADAEDIVQETFARALAQPPAKTDAPWRPWLVRVALNLARDELRRRKRRAYKGPWLPEPVDDAELELGLGAHEPATTLGRYELVESVSFAFLLALEALSPAQRAVLLLRDVFQYTSAEAADALDLSEANARVLLHRARRAMADYDATRWVPDAAARERSRETLVRFMTLFAKQDVAGMEELLTEDVVTLNDTNGRYPAAGVPVIGRSKVARFHAGVARLRAKQHPVVEFRWMNGTPCVAVQFDPPPDDGLAPRFVVTGELDAAGRVRRIYTVLAPEKLRALSPSGTGFPSTPRRRRRASRPRA